jgi:hypothetical protein
MEVHAHAHTPRKKWTHYFWEFLMLFLAVFCGFLAENQREHYVEHQREKQYIRSLIGDLKEDTGFIREAINQNLHGCLLIDSLIKLLAGHERNNKTGEIYYLARLIPFRDLQFTVRNETYDQLKSSGNLRLIKKKGILDSISAYYNLIMWAEKGPSAMQFENRHDLYLYTDKLFNAAVFQQMMQSPDPLTPNFPGANAKLLSEDPQIINAVCSRYHYMYSTKKVLIRYGENLINIATRLIILLKNKYNLE